MSRGQQKGEAVEKKLLVGLVALLWVTNLSPNPSMAEDEVKKEGLFRKKVDTSQLFYQE